VIEPFTPTESQQSRMSEDDYAAMTAITLAALSRVEIENALPDGAAVDDFAVAYQLALYEEMLHPTQAILDGGAAIADWEQAISGSVVTAVLLGLLIGVGGVAGLRSQFNPRGILQFTKASLIADLRAVQYNAEQIALARKTPGQILAILQRRSNAMRGSYERTKHAVLIASGVANEGRRMLGSVHPCPNCPDYERLDWVPLTEIVPVATLCLCQSFCQCRVETRFNPQRALEEMTGGTLANRVERAAAFQSEVETRWQSTWPKGG
jgi:hypothetical protein